MSNVNIAVCGKFHYSHYVQFIEQQGLLGNFYYSHRRSTNAEALKISVDKAHNLYLKEYLGFVHRKFLERLDYAKAITKYQDIWQWQLLNQWKQCDIFHTINHGAAIKVCLKAKAEGTLVLGEPVNSSPENMFSLIKGEHDRLALPYYKELPDTFRRMIEEESYFDYYLSPSSFVTESYLSKGVASDRIFTLPFGVDLNNFHYKQVAKKKFKVIYVAQITPRKAHIDLLKAWKLLNLPRESAELIFIGHVDPIMKPFMEKYQGLFTYLGTVPNNKLVDYYNSSSVFVMPSVEEGCSYAPLEAMASGLPVILTANTGSAEYVTHGKEGFVVPIRGHEKIAEYLEVLYRDRDLCFMMGQNAYEKSRESFGWISYADKLTEMYHRILA